MKKSSSLSLKYFRYDLHQVTYVFKKYRPQTEEITNVLSHLVSSGVTVHERKKHDVYTNNKEVPSLTANEIMKQNYINTIL